VISGNMPPWRADPEYGSFSNSFALPPPAKRQLIAWLDAGARGGGGPDPPGEGSAIPPDTGFPPGPGAAEPVLTVAVPKGRATGPEPYRTFQVRSENASNVWLRAVALVPSNPAVVHHYTAYQPLPSDVVGEINLGFGFYVPGRTAQAYPEGTGMYLGQLSPVL